MIPPHFVGPAQTMVRVGYIPSSPGFATRPMHRPARGVLPRNWNRFAVAPLCVAGSPLPPHQSAAAVPRDELQAALPGIASAMDSSSSLDHLPALPFRVPLPLKKGGNIADELTKES